MGRIAGALERLDRHLFPEVTAAAARSPGRRPAAAARTGPRSSAGEILGAIDWVALGAGGTGIPPCPPVWPQDALTVPAVEAARNLLWDVLATQPLVVVDKDRTVLPDPPGWLGSPDPDRTLWAVLADTVEDLLFYGYAVWEVTRFAADGWPAAFQVADRSRFARDQYGGWLVDGDPMTDRDRRQLVVFDMAGYGLLWTARRSIHTCLQLAAATDRYAAMDIPTLAIRNTGPDLDDDEADALLATFQQAMATRSTAFMNAPVELQQFAWDASQLQLVEARREAAADVARHVGVPGYYLLASDGGTSLTYTNVESEHRNLVSLYLARWVACLEQTLSRYVVRGRYVRLDFTELLRADPLTRIQVWQAGTAIGAITPQQAAQLEPLWPDPVTGQSGG